MSNTPHELAQEFPEHLQKMHALKTGIPALPGSLTSTTM